MKRNLKTVAWHKLNGSECQQSSPRWFHGVTHRVVGETSKWWVYDNGFVRCDAPQGSWITDELENLDGSDIQELLTLDIWTVRTRRELNHADK